MRENVLDVTDRQGLRDWLEMNHSRERECYVRCTRGRPSDDTLSYIDVVEEALCFGWVDSTLVRCDGILLQRLSPRRRNGHWSEINKERARRMERLGLMTEAGREALPDMTEDIRILFPEIMSILDEDPEMTAAMNDMAPLYVRVRLDGIDWAKGTEDFQERLSRFISETKAGRMYGQWNDYGRLLR